MKAQPKTPLSEFLAKSRSRYLLMCVRQTPGRQVSFTLAEFRHWLTDKLAGAQGTARCLYCNAVVNIHTLQIDHRLPLAQGGSSELSNLAISCKCCNAQKGAMRAQAFIYLQLMVNNPAIFNEFDRDDLLGRLQSQLKLALAAQKTRASRVPSNTDWENLRPDGTQHRSKQSSKTIRIVPHIRQPRKAANGD